MLGVESNLDKSSTSRSGTGEQTRSLKDFPVPRFRGTQELSEHSRSDHAEQSVMPPSCPDAGDLAVPAIWLCFAANAVFLCSFASQGRAASGR